MAGFESIYNEHFHSVYRYIFSLCQNEALAEEITQETFFKAFENMDRFHGECRLYVWLCQIAKNTYFSYLKKQKRYASANEHEPNDFYDNTLENELIDHDTAWQIQKILHQLDNTYKEVFMLRVFAELSFSQIGELFGKTDSWARLVFYRTKKELRRRLHEDSL